MKHTQNEILFCLEFERSGNLKMLLHARPSCISANKKKDPISIPSTFPATVLTSRYFVLLDAGRSGSIVAIMAKMTNDSLVVEFALNIFTELTQYSARA